MQRHQPNPSSSVRLAFETLVRQHENDSGIYCSVAHLYRNRKRATLVSHIGMNTSHRFEEFRNNESVSGGVDSCKRVKVSQICGGERTLEAARSEASS